MDTIASVCVWGYSGSQIKPEKATDKGRKTNKYIMGNKCTAAY
ncbi:MAG TPA: hypothetical protein V6D35_04235 [Candidatus Sericytochromatia bacterium]